MPLTLWKQDLMPTSPGHSIFQEPNTSTWRTQSWRLILTVGLKKSCTALPQNHLQKSCSLRAILATPARNRVWFLPKTRLLEKAILILLPQGLLPIFTGQGTCSGHLFQHGCEQPWPALMGAETSAASPLCAKPGCFPGHCSCTKQAHVASDPPWADNPSCVLHCTWSRAHTSYSLLAPKGAALQNKPGSLKQKSRCCQRVVWRAFSVLLPRKAALVWTSGGCQDLPGVRVRTHCMPQSHACDSVLQAS